MSVEPTRTGKRLKFTLVVRDEADDPSILDIVRQAVRDADRAPPAPVADSPPVAEPPTGPRVPLGEDVEDRARDAIEEALAQIPVPTDPAFDPAKWAEQHGKVWTLVRQSKALGGEVRVPPDDPPPATS